MPIPPSLARLSPPKLAPFYRAANRQHRPELNYNEYAGIDTKGKIVLIFNHELQEADAASIFS
jgi:hypothetical protein